MALTRDFTVAVFVVHADRVLLHFHRKLGLWLPPGGHIEPHELPDDAALREVAEETGVRARLVGERGVDLPSPPYPRALTRPAGIQLEDIAPDHQQVDLVYFAAPEPGGEACAPEGACEPGTGWYALDELEALGANEEIRAWAARAVAAVRSS
jgi:ADP-ribose pyrophosphatase YjhB (NUDIX family)